MCDANLAAHAKQKLNRLARKTPLHLLSPSLAALPVHSNYHFNEKSLHHADAATLASWLAGWLAERSSPIRRGYEDGLIESKVAAAAGKPGSVHLCCLG